MLFYERKNKFDQEKNYLKEFKILIGDRPED